MKKLLFVIALVAAFVITARAATTQLNVQSFGATGNGITDDGAAIQRALDAAVTTKQQLYFPAGTYRTSRALQAVSPPTVPFTYNVDILGTLSSTIQYVGTAPISAVLLLGTNVNTYGYSVRNLRILGNTHSTNALQLITANHWNLDNLFLGECTGAGLYLGTNVIGTASNIRVSANEIGTWTVQPAVGIHAYFCNEITIISPTIEKVGSIGILLDHNSLDCMVLGGTSEGNAGGASAGAGITIRDNSNRARIIGLDCEQNGVAFDVLIEGSVKAQIVNGYYDSGIFVTNSYKTVLDGPSFQDLVIATNAYNTTIRDYQVGLGAPGGTMTIDSNETSDYGGLNGYLGSNFTNWFPNLHTPRFTARGINGDAPSFLLNRTNATAGRRLIETIIDGDDFYAIRSLSNSAAGAPYTNLFRIQPNQVVRFGDPASQQLALQILETTNANGPNVFFRHYTAGGLMERALRLNSTNFQLLSTNYTLTHVFGNDGSFTSIGPVSFPAGGSILTGLTDPLNILESGADGSYGEFLSAQLPAPNNGTNYWKNSLYSSVSSAAGLGGLQIRLATGTNTQQTVAEFFNDGSASILGDLAVGGEIAASTLNLTALNTGTLNVTNTINFLTTNAVPANTNAAKWIKIKIAGVDYAIPASILP